jgi:hypothetical protein
MIAIEQRRRPEGGARTTVQVRPIRTDRIVVSKTGGGRRSILVLRHRAATLAAASAVSR